MMAVEKKKDKKAGRESLYVQPPDEQNEMMTMMMLVTRTQH